MLKLRDQGTSPDFRVPLEKRIELLTMALSISQSKLSGEFETFDNELQNTIECASVQW